MENHHCIDAEPTYKLPERTIVVIILTAHDKYATNIIMIRYEK